ncbi:MAG: hypothetical protein V3U32_06040 [Anaerolineales bacterium]
MIKPAEIQRQIGQVITTRNACATSNFTDIRWSQRSETTRVDTVGIPICETSLVKGPIALTMTRLDQSPVSIRKRLTQITRPGELMLGGRRSIPGYRRPETRKLDVLDGPEENETPLAH